jgi:hypothetical protein
MQVRRRVWLAVAVAEGNRTRPTLAGSPVLKTGVGRCHMWRHPDAGPSGSLFVLGPEVRGPAIGQGRMSLLVWGCPAFVPRANAKRCETMSNVEQSNPLVGCPFRPSAQVSEVGSRALTRRRSQVRDLERPREGDPGVGWSDVGGASRQGLRRRGILVCRLIYHG